MEYVSSWIKLVLIIGLRAFPLFNILDFTMIHQLSYINMDQNHYNTLSVHINQYFTLTGQNGYAIQMHTTYLYFYHKARLKWLHTIHLFTIYKITMIHQITLYNHGSNHYNTLSVLIIQYFIFTGQNGYAIQMHTV